MAAPLGHHLVFDVRRRDPGIDVQLRRALDVEDVAVADVHVDDHRRDVKVLRLVALVGVADRHRELELAQSAHRPARAVGDLDARIEIHVGAAEMADRERVAAEVHRVESVGQPGRWHG